MPVKIKREGIGHYPVGISGQNASHLSPLIVTDISSQKPKSAQRRLRSNGDIIDILKIRHEAKRARVSKHTEFVYSDVIRHGLNVVPDRVIWRSR